MVFKRHQQLSLKRGLTLEHESAIAMSLRNMAEH